MPNVLVSLSDDNDDSSSKEPLQHHHHHHDQDHDHDHHHDHDHKHGCTHSHSGWRSLLPHTHSLESRLHADTRSLSAAFFILVTAFTLQLVGSLIAHSSVLAVEAVHSALDGLTVIISLISVFVAARAPTERFTYGFSRAELLSALVSIIALALLCCKLFAGAVQRLSHIVSGTLAPIHVEGRVVFIAEGITLAANTLMVFVLARGGSLNIRALRAHVIADSVENVVVLCAGGLMWAFPKASIIDPILTIVIVGVIAMMNIGIGTETISALMQAAPGDTNVGSVATRVEKVDGVIGNGEIHIWALTSGCSIGSAVIFVEEGCSFEEAERIRTEVQQAFTEANCSQVTVQVCLQPIDKVDE